MAGSDGRDIHSGAKGGGPEDLRRSVFISKMKILQ